MKITRTHNQKHSYTIQIDRCDLALYRSHNWQRHDKGLIRYPSKDHHRGSIFLHRAIMGVGPELYVVHRSGDKFDCRRENLEVITYQEQRERQKKPFIRTMNNVGRLASINFYTRTYKKPSGKTYTYRYVDMGFCYRYKQTRKRFPIHTLGLEEASRRALAWRVSMMQQHGLTPNIELLDMLERVTRMAKAGGGFEEIYGGNAEYEGSKVIGSESSFQVVGFDYGMAA